MVGFVVTGFLVGVSVDSGCTVGLFVGRVVGELFLFVCIAVTIELVQGPCAVAFGLFVGTAADAVGLVNDC